VQLRIHLPRLHGGAVLNNYELVVQFYNLASLYSLMLTAGDLGTTHT
jgi:hypothetical protein